MNEHDIKTRFAPHFSAMSSEDRSHVAEALVVQHVPAGTRMMTMDELNDRVYFLADGDVEIHVDCSGTRLQLGSRSGGSWVGELGFIEPGPASASVDAKTEIEAWVLTHEAFEQLQKDAAGAAAALTELVCRDIAARLRESDTLSFRREGDHVAIALHADEDKEGHGLLAHLKELLGLGGRS